MLYAPGRITTSLLVAVIACAVILLPLPVRAQDTETFDIPAQELASALRAFAVATGTEILYTPEMVVNRRSAALVGQFTVEEALQRLLGGTDLAFERTGETVVVLKERLESGARVNPVSARIDTFQARTGGGPGGRDAVDDPPPGILEGVVRDAATGTPLAGAEVTIEGTPLREVSDDRGRFHFPDLAPGVHVVRVDWFGTASDPIEVEIEAGRALELDVDVGESTLDTIVVLGYRSGLQRALNQQRTAANNSTVVSADLLGGFPAETVSEALRRVPGVAFGRDDVTGEGSRITIRGFSSEAINVQLNGLDLQGTGFQRTIDLSGFLADNISQVTIHKSLLPSHEATGSGGLVEIETKSGLDYGDFMFTVGAEGERSIENEFGDESQANAILAKKLTDDFGIAATLQYRQSDRRNYNVDIQHQLPAVMPEGFLSVFNVPASQQFPFDDAFNERLITSAGYLRRNLEEEDVAASLNAAWDIGDHTRLRLDLQRNQRDLQAEFSRTTAGYLVGRFDMPIPELDGEVRRRMVLGSFRPSLNLATQDVKTTTETISFRGDTEIKRWRFEYKLGWSGAETVADESNLNILANSAANIEDIIDPDAMVLVTDDDPDATQRIADGAFTVLPNGVAVPLFSQLGRDYFFDLSQYNVNSANRSIYDSPTDAYVAEAGVHYDFSPGFLQYVETGFKYDRSKRHSVDDLFAAPGVGIITPAVTYNDIFGVPTSLADLGGNLSLGQDLSAIGAGAFSAPFLSAAEGDFIFDRLDSFLVDDPSTPFNEARFTKQDLRQLDPINDQDALTPASSEEDKLAVWLESEIRLGDFEIAGGARVERTKRTGTAISIPSITLDLPGFVREPRETFVDAGLVDFASLTGTDTTVTPSILINYRPVDNLVVRLGYFHSTVNPDFRLLRRQTQYFIDFRPAFNRGIIREGNPDLKPTTAHNYDLDVAWYFRDTPGVLRAGLFYKDVSNNFTNVLLADQPTDLRQRFLDHFQPLADSRPELLEFPDDMEFVLNRPQNGDGGKIWGAELEIVRQLDFLPGFLSDFGVLANATYTDGDFPTLLSGFDDDGNFTDFSLDRPLADEPEWVYNASLNYARGGFEGRVIYTYQSATVASYEIHDLNTVIPSYSTLDCRLSYNFTGPGDSLITLFLEGDDLLRSSTEADIRSAIEPTFGRGDASYSFPLSLQFNGGSTVTAGVRARF